MICCLCLPEETSCIVQHQLRCWGKPSDFEGIQGEVDDLLARLNLDINANFTFDGHNQKRTNNRRVLSDRELAAGAVSLVYVSHRLHRHWEKTPLLRKVLQVLWHVVSHADQIFLEGEFDIRKLRAAL